jgi:LPS export ABC transporter protein LptC
MMTKRRKTLLILLAAAAIVLVVVILWVGGRKEPGKALLKIMADRVDLQVRNVRYTEVGDAGMKWEIMADTARYQKKDNLAFFETLTVRLVMKDGSTYRMNGDKGRFNTESRDLEIEGHVAIVSPRGERFTTDRLQYRNAGKRIETDSPVLMEGRGVRISGVGMVFSITGEKVSILSQVRANAQGGVRERR